VQTRIVDGQIVLDEQSLEADLAAAHADTVHEYVDENERERFVNSATRGKRKGVRRWDADETQKFYKVRVSSSSSHLRAAPLACTPAHADALLFFIHPGRLAMGQ
jgi:hypothetical protein